MGVEYLVSICFPRVCKDQAMLSLGYAVQWYYYIQQQCVVTYLKEKEPLYHGYSESYLCQITRIFWKSQLHELQKCFNKNIRNVRKEYKHYYCYNKKNIVNSTFYKN
jgi:hypothetical protein